MNGNGGLLRNVLSIVGAGVLLAAVLTWAVHWGNSAIHQGTDEKRNQDQVWWLINWKLTAEPVILDIRTDIGTIRSDLKQVIMELRERKDQLGD